jgi:hypothetical protein
MQKANKKVLCVDDLGADQNCLRRSAENGSSSCV